MKKLLIASLLLILIIQHRLLSQNIYAKENLVAWCVVPFDSVNRTSEQRIALLKDLGIRQYAYDWRERHLATMAAEWKLAIQNKVDVKAVWCWIDENTDSPGALGGDNKKVFSALKEAGLKTQLWVGFNDNFFEGLNEEEKIRKGVRMLQTLHEEAAATGSRVALYNHGSWFGEPENQIKIIQASGFTDVGIIYNFHHAHSQLDRFPEIISKTLPYLWTVNLNGMKKEGPQILPLGEGNLELDMMKYLKESGFKGDIGILGHVENADVEVILRQNLEGMKKLLNQMGDSEALKTYR